MRGMRAAGVLIRDEVRERHRLAELLEADRRGHKDTQGRDPILHPVHRGTLSAMRRTSRTRLRRRTAADPSALLHQRHRPRIRAAIRPAGEGTMTPVKLASMRALLFGLLALSASSLAGTPKTEEATFAAGCFWHVEAAFRKIDGVLEVISGYTGGMLANPNYEQVCSDKTGHAESIQIEFDPSRVSYDRLLDVFWREHDPTTLNRQGWDVGTQYRSAIFYHSAAQQAAAMASKQRLEKSAKYGTPIVTQILPAGPFYRAEDYHQRYFEKHPEAELGHADWPAAAAPTHVDPPVEA